MAPKIFLCSVRNAKYFEDAHAIEYRNNDMTDLCVIDGVSGFHSPQVPNRMFYSDGVQITGGQAVAQLIRRTFVDPNPGWSLAEVLEVANNAIRHFARRNDIPNQADDLPAAHIAAARLSPDAIEIIQTGDCCAIIEYHNGDIYSTPNSEWEFGKYEVPRQKELLEQHGSMAEVWNRIEPEFRCWRRELTNVRYPTLNGQAACQKLWNRQAFLLRPIRRLLLLTDGLVKAEDLRSIDTARPARGILEHYDTGGWDAVIEAKGRDKIGEGTGIAVEFVSK